MEQVIKTVSARKLVVYRNEKLECKAFSAELKMAFDINMSGMMSFALICSAYTSCSKNIHIKNAICKVNSTHINM